MKRTEADLHRAICIYIQLQYPLVIFNSDLSGQNTTKRQSVVNKDLRSSKGFPDIIIYESCNNYHALFLEVKKETPYKKDGTLKSNKHLEEQQEMHNRLKDKGYYARFVWDFEQAKETVDFYLTKKI